MLQKWCIIQLKIDKMIEAIKKAERVVRELVLLVLEIGTLLTVIKAIIDSLF